MCLLLFRLDRCFLELMQDGEEAFLNFRRVCESANVIMATYADEALGDTAVSCHPCKLAGMRAGRCHSNLLRAHSWQECVPWK